MFKFPSQPPWCVASAHWGFPVPNTAGWEGWSATINSSESLCTPWKSSVSRFVHNLLPSYRDANTEPNNDVRCDGRGGEKSGSVFLETQWKEIELKVCRRQCNSSLRSLRVTNRVTKEHREKHQWFLTCGTFDQQQQKRAAGWRLHHISGEGWSSNAAAVIVTISCAGGLKWSAGGGAHVVSMRFYLISSQSTVLIFVESKVCYWIAIIKSSLGHEKLIACEAAVLKFIEQSSALRMRLWNWL